MVGSEPLQTCGKSVKRQTQAEDLPHGSVSKIWKGPSEVPSNGNVSLCDSE